MKAAVTCLCFLLAAVALIGWAQVKKPATAPSVFAAPHPGRYQIVFGNHARADTFLLDTETGRIWQRTTITNIKGDPDVWLIQERFDTDSDYALWGLKQSFKPTPTPSPIP